MLTVGAAGNFMGTKHTLKNYKKEQNYSNITFNYEERAIWEKEGSPDIMDKARDYVNSLRDKVICPITEEQRERLDEAFIEVCLDAGLTEETALDLIRKYDEA